MRQRRSIISLSSLPVALCRVATVASLVCGSVLVSTPVAHADDVFWATNASGLWSEPTNWSDFAVPGSDDDAHNPFTDATITLNGNATIQSFVSNGAFAMAGGTLLGSLSNATSTVQVNNTFTASGVGLSNLTLNAGSGGEGIHFANNNNYLSNVICNANIALSNGGLALSGNVTMASGNAINIADSSSTVLISNGTLSGTVTVTGGALQFGGYSGDGNNVLNGTTINGDLSFGNYAYSRLDNAVTVNGNIALASNYTALQLKDSNASLTLESGSTLHGNNGLSQLSSGATLINKGTVSADLNQQGMSIAVSNILNNGTLEARNGATLSLSGNITMASGSVINIADPSSTVLISNGTISGAANVTGGVLQFGGYSGDGNNVIEGATINGDLGFGNYAYSRLDNAVTVNGTVNLSSNYLTMQLADSSASLTLETGAKLRGYGTINQINDGATLTNNGTISADANGSGLSIAASNIANSGVLEAKDGGRLSLSGNINISSNGTLVAKNGGILSLSGHIDMASGSTIDIADSSSMVLISNGTLAGTVTMLSGSGGTIQFGGYSGDGNNVIDGATISGKLFFGNYAFARLDNAVKVNGDITMNSDYLTMQLNDSNASLTLDTGSTLNGVGIIDEASIGSTLVNNGTIRADDSVVYHNGITIAVSNIVNNGTLEAINGKTLTLYGNLTDNGDISIASGSNIIFNESVTQTGVNAHATVNGVMNLANSFTLEGGTLQGTGVISGDVVNTGGTVSSALTILGNYAQQSGGLFLERLGGTENGQFDHLAISSSASLGGTLDILLLGNYQPHIGDTFDILTASSISGTFSNIVSLNPGFTYDVSYGASSVRLTVTGIGSFAAPEPGVLMFFVPVSLVWLCNRRRQF